MNMASIIMARVASEEDWPSLSKTTKENWVLSVSNLGRVMFLVLVLFIWAPCLVYYILLVCMSL